MQETGMELRIDELAQHASVPKRTIRYYTQQGLLHPPQLKGRVGFYDSSHVERLRLIKELQEKRYLPLSIIKRVLKQAEAGRDLEKMLAPLDMVFAPRGGGEKVLLTREELADRAGVDESVADAADEMGFLFPIRRGRERLYTQDDVQMLEVASEWIRLGLPRELADVYRSSLEQIANLQVRAFGRNVLAPLAGQHLEPDEFRSEIAGGLAEMSQTCSRLVALLHRKLLQKSVESLAARTERGGGL